MNWWKDGKLRVLYWHCAVLSVASVTTGYDGMMLNTSQLMDPWQEFFGEPEGALLGLLNNACVDTIPITIKAFEKFADLLAIAIGTTLGQSSVSSWYRGSLIALAGRSPSLSDASL